MRQIAYRGDPASVVGFGESRFDPGGSLGTGMHGMIARATSGRNMGSTTTARTTNLRLSSTSRGSVGIRSSCVVSSS